MWNGKSLNLLFIKSILTVTFSSENTLLKIKSTFN